MAEGSERVIVSRRTVLGLVPVVPFAFRAMAQRPSVPRARRFISGLGGFYVIEPDGTVKAWTAGHSNASSIGLGRDESLAGYVAQEVPALKGATAIAGGAAGYAVTSDGRVLAWGDNWNGLLGNTPLSELEATGVQHPVVPTPTMTLAMPKIVDVATGSRHALALTTDGRVFAWGNGQVGQLGNGPLPVVNFKTKPPDINYFVPYPVQVPGLADVIAIGAGPEFSVALLKDGTIRAWGLNASGELGDGTTETRTRPVQVRGISSAIAIAVGPGANFVVALLSDGTVMTWGHGGSPLGRPGIDRHTVYPIPAPVPGLTGVTAIAAGGAHVVALGSTGRITSWGVINVYDPVGHPGETPAVVPIITTARAIFADSLGSQALLADGTFMAWGALPSLMFRVDGGGDGAHWPVPVVVKGL